MADLTLARAAERPLGVGGRIARFVRRYGWGYAFVLPSLITFSVFTLVPVVWAFLISLQEYRLSGSQGWVGFDNYHRLHHPERHLPDRHPQHPGLHRLRGRHEYSRGADPGEPDPTPK